MSHVTTYAELLNALAVVRDRANADGLPSHTRAVRMWRATDALWHDEFEQVTNRGRDDVVVVLEIIVVARESAEGAGYIIRDGRFFGDN